RRQEQGKLVHVFDHDVVSPLGQGPAHGAAAEQREAVPAAHALHADAVQLGAPRPARPAARNQIDLVPPSRQPAEQGVQVDLRASGVRVVAVVPVDEQDPHSAPDSRATASSTPLTNPGAFAPANQCASLTASSITTRAGVTPSAISARASRRMLRSTTPTRSNRQCSAASATRRSNSRCPATACAARSAPRSYASGARPYITATRAITVSMDGSPESSHA